MEIESNSPPSWIRTEGKRFLFLESRFDVGIFKGIYSKDRLILPTFRTLEKRERVNKLGILGKGKGKI